MQNIECLDCAKRIMSYPDDQDPDFNSSFIEGTLIPRKEPGRNTISDLDTGELLSDVEVPDYLYLCDSCNSQMPVGTRAVAWSMWHADSQRESWEHLFLTDMKTIKEVLR